MAAAFALAAPAGAHAAPFGELPSFAARDGVSCLSATGEPGGIAHGLGLDLGFPGRTELLRADATGLHPGAPLPAAPYGSCSALDLRPDGVGIEAHFFAEAPGESGVRAVLREGGRWGEPVKVHGDLGTDSLDAAISDSGAAVVAAAGGTASGFEVTATRRAPGAAFGANETLMRAPDTAGSVSLQAGVTAAGETVLAWSFRPRLKAPRQLWATYAAPGEPFHAPVRVGAPRGPFALAVGDGGDAVLAFTADKRMHVAERVAGAAFGTARDVGVADDPLVVFPAAAVRPDGAAVVGWVDFLDGAVRAVTRPAAGAFGGELRLAPSIWLGFDRALFDESISPDFRDSDYGFEDQIQIAGATFAGDRALLAWTASTRRDGVYAFSPSVAAVPLAGGPAEVHPLGNGLRDIARAAPLVLADGTPAVVWADDEEQRVSLAVEGAAGVPDVGAPRLRVGAPEQRFLRADDPLVLPVTCSAACDVRVSSAEGVFDATAALSLRRAGTETVTLRPEVRPIARLDGKPVRVYVRWGAPGTAHPRSRTVLVRVRRKPGPPAPRVERLRARHDGDDVVVTWRTDRKAGKDDFLAFARAERDGDALKGAVATGSGRHFRARIRDVATARFVTLLTGPTPGIERRTTVEIKS